VRRRDGLVGLVATVALGLGSRRIHLGVAIWDKSLGDVLYTVMVYLVLAAARPRTQPRTLAIGAFAISFAIELFQLSGIPAAMPRILHLVFGTTFAWHDVLCYAVGAGAAALGDSLTRRRVAAALGRSSRAS
jgi:hypothetical protein